MLEDVELSHAPSPGSFSPAVEHSRRQFIEAHFDFHYVWSSSKWKAHRAAAGETVSSMLHNTLKARQVGDVFFRYEADHIAWSTYVEELNSRPGRQVPHHWPWAFVTDPYDTKHGISMEYRAWRLAKGYPTEPNHVPQNRAPSSLASVQGVGESCRAPMNPGAEVSQPAVPAPHSGRVTGMINGPQDLGRFGQSFINTSADQAVSFRMGSVRRDQQALLNRKSTMRRTTSNLEPLIDRIPKVQEKRCANCGLDTHSMYDCLFAPEGLIFGCTFCNTRDHAVDNCIKFEQMSLEEKTEYLVHSRGRRPGLKTTKPWGVYLRDYLTANGDKAKLPGEFPWSADFAYSKAEDFTVIRALQSAWNRDKNVEALPQDPSRVSFEAAGRIFWPDAGHYTQAR
ncbi:hypothetical protein FPOAC2_07749 [Fusarium poae]|uniref:Uncharacterized protein n=1 Tax=Fusarium poae TaxID=36050 RepID=A0A1B8AJF4_FUSPO|nr:hypothetical protein FPOAC1_007843 [Fusarium poae]KAG8668464.1 hypothetical protein FPOAC1_007843 [Fusarium poae]OBS20709.1 hypothetical protein FPOA_07049 [Fusarium poae]